jgi:hypothetical protein
MIDVDADADDVFAADGELCELTTRLAFGGIAEATFCAHFVDDTAEAGARGGPRALAPTHQLPADLDEGQGIQRPDLRAYLVLQILPRGLLTDLILRQTVLED